MHFCCNKVLQYSIIGKPKSINWGNFFNKNIKILNCNQIEFSWKRFTHFVTNLNSIFIKKLENTFTYRESFKMKHFLFQIAMFCSGAQRNHFTKDMNLNDAKENMIDYKKSSVTECKNMFSMLKWILLIHFCHNNIKILSREKVIGKFCSWKFFNRNIFNKIIFI